MQLIDADKLLKDLYDWKDEVECNPYISGYERILKENTIESAIYYVKEQPIIMLCCERNGENVQ